MARTAVIVVVVFGGFSLLFSVRLSCCLSLSPSQPLLLPVPPPPHTHLLSSFSSSSPPPQPPPPPLLPVPPVSPHTFLSSSHSTHLSLFFNSLCSPSPNPPCVRACVCVLLLLLLTPYSLSNSHPLSLHLLPHMCLLFQPSPVPPPAPFCFLSFA